jgi:hypothetical protein
VKEFSDYVRESLVRTHVVDHEHVRVVQRSRGARLALEALESHFVTSELLRENLDCDLAIEPRVTRAIDLAHSANTNERENLVRA